jgi:large subunit ribosomal protein L14
VECIHVLNGSRHAYIGDRIVCVVQRVRLIPGAGDIRNKSAAAAVTKVSRGDVRRAIVVRTKYQTQRKDGSVIRFDDNACVLIDDKGEPIGNRISGTIFLKHSH